MLDGAQAKFELLAMVSCEGNSMAEGEYSAVVLKGSKWVHMTCSETTEVDADKVKSGFNPQILFFRKTEDQVEETKGEQLEEEPAESLVDPREIKAEATESDIESSI